MRLLSQLNLSGCAGIKELPEDLQVQSWIDVAGTGLKGLPKAMRGVRIRWRGVFIDERIAFRPETLKVSDILSEFNTEVRRVMLERVGFDWFLEHAGAQTLDSDRDTGGERRLLRIELQNDEPLVCLQVNCPSTGRRYVLRVPPTMQSCHQAAAWMAGFEDHRDYRPILET
jgi:hypothetical protein